MASLSAFYNATMSVKECIAGSRKIGGDGKSGSALEGCLRPGQTIS
jgi:hypothetical protein